MTADRATTIYDIAKAAKVSPSTVSRVLNNAPNVRPEKRDAVQTAITRLNYRPNRVARGLRSRRSSVWALVVPDLENPFFTRLARGVEDVAWQHSSSVLIANSDESVQKEAAYLSVAVEENVAGVILVPASNTESVLEPLTSRGIPTVLADRIVTDADVDTIVSDNEQGGYLGTRYLLERGHRRVACIVGPPSNSSAIDRLLGYERALGSAGIAVDPRLIMRADHRIAGGRRTIERLMRRREPPEGVFITNNLMTLGALEGLWRSPDLSTSRVPDIVGFDSGPWRGALQPQIPTVEQDALLLGKRAAQMIVRRLARPDIPAEHLVLTPRLRIWETLAAEVSTIETTP